ncbi:hypothetical protein ACQKWADRAFT_294479 [Trichoderma austrokoningii]
MTKRKSDNDVSSRSKRAKLDGHDDAASPILNSHTTDSPPPLATPQRLGKRKRRQDPGTESLENPGTKRVRRSSEPSERDARETSPVEVWPSIEYEPDKKEEEPSWIWKAIADSHRQATLFRERQKRLRDSQCIAENCNSLPSPTPSIIGSSESDKDERWDRLLNSEHWDWSPDSESESDESDDMQDAPIRATPLKKTNQLPRNRLRKRNATPRQRKQKQPRKKAKHQGEARHEGSTPTIQEFLRSKRSSRRDAKCVQWHLGDDGKACPI